MQGREVGKRSEREVGKGSEREAGMGKELEDYKEAGMKTVEVGE